MSIISTDLISDLFDEHGLAGPLADRLPDLIDDALHADPYTAEFSRWERYERERGTRDRTDDPRAYIADVSISEAMAVMMDALSDYLSDRVDEAEERRAADEADARDTYEAAAGGAADYDHSESLDDWLRRAG